MRKKQDPPPRPVSSSTTSVQAEEDDEEGRLYAEASALLRKKPLTAEHLRRLRSMKQRVDAVLAEKKAPKKTDDAPPPRYPTAHDQIEGHAADTVDVPGTLASKKEFAQMRQHKSTVAASSSSSAEETVDALADERCKSDEFDLARHQQFLANLISPHTPYNGLLLYHGVGMGKTCTAVNIVEQFPKDTKVVVITQQALASNFKDTVFDTSRLRVNPHTGLVDLVYAANQCTGTKYLDVVPDAELSDKEAVRARISSKVNRRYKMFTTYNFAKRVRAKQELFPDTWPQKLRDQFSDHVFVVDEAHKLRVDAKKEDYRHVSQALRDTLSVTANVRLLLLTATPMYNEAPDILEMFNLLLVNDKMAPVRRAQIFDANGGVLPGSGVRLLTRLSRAYVSYMRGGDPFTFPVRLTAEDVRDPDAMPPSDPRQPTKTAAGTPIPREERFRITTLLRTPMSAYQARLYAEVLKPPPAASSKQKKNNDAVDEEDEEEEEEANENSINTGFMIGTVVFPAAHTALAVGSAGFSNCFVKRGSGAGGMKLSYSPSCSIPGFLAPPHLDTFAPKVSAVMKRACRAEGVVFVYSRFIDMGALPLAVALEHMGFMRYGGTSLLEADPGLQRVWLERMPAEWKRMRQAVTERRWTYVVLSGDTNELSTSYAAEVRAARSQENLHGDVVKVVIATDKASEGMDLKNVREVHVMHPWYHQQKIEQIVGRSARMCSHIALPPAKRNVTVYLHASVKPERAGDQETADVRAYRIAEMKQQRIVEARRIISANAIDCQANREVQFYDPADLGLRLDLVSSQGVVVKNYALGDRPPASPVVCATEKHRKQRWDASTYVPALHVPDVRRCKSVFVKMFAKSPKHVAFTFEEVLRACRAETGREIKVDSVVVAIQEVLDDHTAVQDARGRAGGVIYVSDKYVFQSRDSFDTRESLEERSAEESEDRRCDAAVFSTDENKKHHPGSASVATEDASDVVPLNREQHVRTTSSRSEVSSAAVFRFLEDQAKVLHDIIVRHVIVRDKEKEETKRGFVSKTFGRVVVDFVVDRIPHAIQAKLVQEAFIVQQRASRRKGVGAGEGGEDAAHLLLTSLADGGFITAMDPAKKKAVLKDPVTDAEACVSVKSARTDERPEECVRGEQRQPRPSPPPAARVQGYLLPPQQQHASQQFTRRMLSKARNSLEPGEKGVFKVLGDSRESSGFVCFQTSMVKSDDIAAEVIKLSDERDLRLDPAVLRSSDKRSLCHMYEVTLRLVRPEAFLRPPQAHRVFGRNPGKRRASSL